MFDNLKKEWRKNTTRTEKWQVCGDRVINLCTKGGWPLGTRALVLASIPMSLANHSIKDIWMETMTHLIMNQSEQRLDNLRGLTEALVLLKYFGMTTGRGISLK
jgi:hypothetical protein